MRREVLLATAFASFAGAGGALHRPTLTIRIDNHSPVSVQELAQASQGAHQLFARAGLEVRWQICPGAAEPCEETTPPLLPSLRIVGPPIEQSLANRGRMGVAVPEQNVAFLLFRTIRDSQFAAIATFPAALAYVMAHEAGHLLGLHHSEGSLMCSSFDERAGLKARRFELNFDDEEIRILRSASPFCSNDRELASACRPGTPDALPFR